MAVLATPKRELKEKKVVKMKINLSTTGEIEVKEEELAIFILSENYNIGKLVTVKKNMGA